MMYIWILALFLVVSCEKDFDMKKHVGDFLNDLTSDQQTDHSHHDMGGHNHGNHDSHSGHNHEGHMMMMWFHGGHKEVILFDFWRIDSCCGLTISCIFIFFMGAAYEGLKWFRVYLQVTQTRRLKAEIPVAVANQNGSHKTENGTSEPLVMTISSTEPSKRNGAFSIARLTQGFLYVVQLVLAYWLMLIVMTYNSWLTAAVILGAGFGHWLFAVLQLDNVQCQAADSFATDACH